MVQAPAYAECRRGRCDRAHSPPHVLLEHDNDTRVELSTVLVTDAIHRAHVADPHAVVGVADVGRRLDVAASTASRLVGSRRHRRHDRARHRPRG